MSAAVPIQGNRFCIVGGASLVGSATASELLDHGAAEVVLFDNFAFGSEAAIAHLNPDPPLRRDTRIAAAATLSPAISGTAAGPLLRKIANLSATTAPCTHAKLPDWNATSPHWNVEIAHHPPGACGPVVILNPPHQDPDCRANRAS